MKNCFIFHIIVSLFLISCSSKNLSNEEVELHNFKSIFFNVYDYKMVLEDESFNMPSYLGFEKTFLLKELTDWGNKKFKVTGKQNSLSLIINDFSLEKKDIKKYKGLKKIFFSEEKVEYNLKLELSLNFTDKDNVSSVLNLNGNISFFIDDSHSIRKKRKFLLASYYELIKKMDKTLEKEINKETFSKFITNL